MVNGGRPDPCEPAGLVDRRHHPADLHPEIHGIYNKTIAYLV